MHLAERKTAWETLHPEAKQGGAPGAGRGKGKKKPEDYKDDNLSSFQTGSESPPQSFTEATSKATEMSKRSIQVSAQIAKNLAPEVKEMLTGTPVEDNKTALSISP